ncbi:MAG: adenylosuccinate lyase [Candidatus Fonsibacter ubiquis]|nr:adenylosuccinate lyase [Candidatus Fonsibacter ubiquis]
MIQRYSREQITKIWQPENKYKIWLDIEIYAAEAMEKFKIIPKGIAKEIRKKAKINPDRIDQIEKRVKHDVIAFLTSITEKVGQKAKFLHQGMTSSDVLDTCFNIQLHQSGKIVGTFAHINPGIEQYVAKKLKFKIEPISTQVIPRDRHAYFFSVLAIIASSAERLATEIRHLQRTEVLEVEEFFSAGQKGSSAMPHKRNPVLSENITGLARLIRSYAYPALENVVLWHERDISHSSVERNIGPDATVTLDFVLTRLSGIIKNLIVYPKNMQKNLEKFNGLIFSQSVLLKLTQKGMTRELAYKVVQKNAMKTWSANESFFDNLNNDKQIKSKLSTEDLKKLFNMNSHLRYINTIYGRVFKS